MKPNVNVVVVTLLKEKDKTILEIVFLLPVTCYQPTIEPLMTDRQ